MECVNSTYLIECILFLDEYCVEYACLVKSRQLNFYSFIQNMDGFWSAYQKRQCLVSVRHIILLSLSLSLCASVPLEKSTQSPSTRQFHITEHSTHDALWRNKATPNKTMESNQIEKNRCGLWILCNTHTYPYT